MMHHLAFDYIGPIYILQYFYVLVNKNDIDIFDKFGR